MALNLPTNGVELSGDNHLQWHSINLAQAIVQYPDLKSTNFLTIHGRLSFFKPANFIKEHIIQQIHAAIQAEIEENEFPPNFASVEEALNFAQGKNLLRAVFLHLQEACSVGDLKPATKQLLAKSFKEAAEASAATIQAPQHEYISGFPKHRLQLQDPDQVFYLAIGGMSASCQYPVNKAIRNLEVGCLRRQITDQFNMPIIQETMTQVDENQMEQTSRFQIKDPHTGYFSGFLFIRIHTKLPLWAPLQTLQLFADTRQRLADETDHSVSIAKQPVMFQPLYFCTLYSGAPPRDNCLAMVATGPTATTISFVMDLLYDHIKQQTGLSVAILPRHYTMPMVFKREGKGADGLHHFLGVRSSPR